MWSTANAWYVMWVLPFLLVVDPATTLAQCGDADQSGEADEFDQFVVWDYLFEGGPPPASFHNANTDGIGNITNNDVVSYGNLFYWEIPLNCADTATNSYFPQSTDTIEFREGIVPAGEAVGILEVWIKAADDFLGLSLPFIADCGTSPINVQGIYFSVGGTGALRFDGSTFGLIGLLNSGSEYPAGEYLLATIEFGVIPQPFDQFIGMSGWLSYPPSNTLVLSRSGAGDPIVGYSPAVFGIDPPTPFTKVVTEPADVVSIATADLDLDTYADVIYAGDTEVGLFVSWGQDAEPPIGTGVKLLDVIDATVDVFHINADTIPDLVAVTATNIYILINNGDRTFLTSVTPNTGASSWSRGQAATSFGTAPQFAIGFIDNDQYPDLVVSPNKWFAGDGTGGFSSNPVFGFSFASVAISDFNGDGYDDFVVIDPTSIAVYSNSDVSPGTFTQAGTLPIGLAGYDLSSITTNVDVNHDGLVDVVAVVAENTGSGDESIVTIALGDGAGNLILADVLTIAGTAPQVSLSDVDRDQYQDVVVSNATDGNLEIYYNDGAGQFGDVELVEIGASDDLMFALTAADLDRDGRPDFISGSEAGSNLIISLNDLPDEPVLEDELFVTGYDNIDVSITNPHGFIISRTLQTVAGSDYYRLQAGYGDALDVRLYDYNLQYGEYEMVAITRPGFPEGDPIVMGIGVDGTKQRFAAINYTRPISAKAAETVEPFIFYFSAEEVSSILPENGLPTADRQPTFDWSGYPVAGPYTFQMDRFHDFSSGDLIYDQADLTEPSYHLPTPLETDSLYYWRFLAPGNYTSRTFAAYIVESLSECCTGRVGDANGEGGDEPTIGDASVMIDAKFITGSCDGILDCLTEADLNQSGGVDPDCSDVTIGDISELIDYLFITGSSLGLNDCL